MAAAQPAQVHANNLSVGLRTPASGAKERQRRMRENEIAKLGTESVTRSGARREGDGTQLKGENAGQIKRKVNK